MACSSRSLICCGVAETVVIACSVRSGGWREESSKTNTRWQSWLKGRCSDTSGVRTVHFLVACKVDGSVYLTWSGKCICCVDRQRLPARRTSNSLPAAGCLTGLLLHAGIRCLRFDVCTQTTKQHSFTPTLISVPSAHFVMYNICICIINFIQQKNVM